MCQFLQTTRAQERTTMTNRSRIATFVAPLLVGMLTLTACGSDDGADATPAAVTSGDADAETEAETEAEAEAETEPASDEATGGGDFCAALAEYASDVSDDELAEAADLERLASIAPSEISDDMQRLAELTPQIMFFDDLNATDDEVAEFESLLTEFGPVSARLDAWTIENCPDLVIE
jgi:hypothetical protein